MCPFLAWDNISGDNGSSCYTYTFIRNMSTPLQCKTANGYFWNPNTP